MFLVITYCTLDVRLISTDSRPYVGTIEVFFNNKWGKICFQEDNVTLSVVCAQLGFGSVGAIPFRRTYISENSRIWLDGNINCIGNEDTIFDCISTADVGKVIDGICSNGAANVICPICKFWLIVYYSYMRHSGICSEL